MGDNENTVDSTAPVVAWQRLLTLSEVFVYKVPPLRTASGHRAEDWGLATPLFTGHMKVFQADTKLRIDLFAYRDEKTLMSSDENLVLFGQCPIEVKPKEDITTYVDSVIDSSRYFVLRLKDPKSARTTSIGIGFREREIAFDLKNVLNDYVRYVDRMAHAEELHSKQEDDAEEEEGEGTPVSLLGDLTLKQGVKIHVASKFKKTDASASGSTSGSGVAHSGLLAPPPSVFTKLAPPPLAPPPLAPPTSATPAAVAAAPSAEVDDDDFGDFEG